MRHKRHYRKAFAAKPYTPTKDSPLKALYGTPSPSRFHAYHHVREKFRKLLLVLRPNVEDADEQHHDHDKHSVLIRKDGIDFSILGVLAVWKFFQRRHEILKQRNGVDLSFPLSTFCFSELCDSSVRVVLKAETPRMGATVYFPHEDAYVDYFPHFRRSHATSNNDSIQTVRRCRDMGLDYSYALTKSQAPQQTVDSTVSKKKVYSVMHPLAESDWDCDCDFDFNLLRLATLRSFYDCLLAFLGSTPPEQQTAENFQRIAFRETTQMPDVQQLYRDLHTEVSRLLARDNTTFFVFMELYWGVLLKRKPTNRLAQ